MDAVNASKVVREMAAMREVYTPLSVAQAIEKAEVIASQPSEYLVPQAQSKEVIAVLLRALKASPCYLKGVRDGIPTFTLLAYDMAGHGAMRVWISLAELHGASIEKTTEARARLFQWERRPDVRWPT